MFTRLLHIRPGKRVRMMEAGHHARSADATATRLARKELARLERTMEKLRDREVKLHADLAAAATDHEQVFALDASLRALHDERATLEHRWLELAEQLG